MHHYKYFNSSSVRTEFDPWAEKVKLLISSIAVLASLFFLQTRKIEFYRLPYVLIQITQM